MEPGSWERSSKSGEREKLFSRTVIGGTRRIYSRVLDLLTQVLKSVSIDVDRALSICQSGEITLTELADWLVRNHQLPFRTAHPIVSDVAGHLSRQPARRRGKEEALKSYAKKLHLDNFK